MLSWMTVFDYLVEYWIHISDFGVILEWFIISLVTTSSSLLNSNYIAEGSQNFEVGNMTGNSRLREVLVGKWVRAYSEFSLFQVRVCQIAECIIGLQSILINSFTEVDFECLIDSSKNIVVLVIFVHITFVDSSSELIEWWKEVFVNCPWSCYLDRE